MDNQTKKQNETYDQIYYKNIVKIDIKRREYIKLCNRLNRLVENTIKNFPETENLCYQIKNNEEFSTYEKLRKIKMMCVTYEFDKMKQEYPDVCTWKKRGISV